MMTMTLGMRRPTQLHRGWLAVSAIALALAATEVLEHQPILLNQLELNYVVEVALLGFVFLLTGEVILGWLNRSNTQPLFMAKAEATTRVLVIDNTILMLGIKYLLSQKPELDVIGITPTTPTAWLDTINRLQPDVVVMDRATDLAQAIGLSTFSSDLPRVRLMMFNAEDEWVQVHDIGQVLITRTDELATLIQDS